ncbi:MAG: A/G-specific adenine glycosylase [Thermoanaerobaculia bacterium]
MTATARSGDRSSPRTRLLRWFDREKRELPWRGSRDPYAVWISEVMLQQTTVQTALARYGPFLRRFPNVRALAGAREDSVLAAWSGLGYYSRARNLHRAAKEILSRHGGRIPQDAESLRELPGFGPYTAAAVAAIAFGKFALPMDANIRRVVSRLFATENPRERLSRVIDRERAGDSIAALFDLGQEICRPQTPSCPACPVSRNCRARREGSVARFPERKRLAPFRPVYLCAAATRRKGKYWLRRRKSTWLSGLWEFPAFEAASRRRARADFRRAYPDATLLGETEHTVVRRKIRVEVYETGVAPRDSEGQWMTVRQIRQGASPTLTRKIADLLSRGRLRA